jgi:hypothetical protein
MTVVRPQQRRYAGMTLAGLIAAVMGALTLSGAAAAQDVITDDGYKGMASGQVTCDAAGALMTVTATALPLRLEGLYGFIPGPYDAGQPMRYRVLVRAFDAPDWTVVWDWSTWVTGPDLRALADGSVTMPVSLGTAPITVTPGYDYVVQVQVDFWRGYDYIVNAAMSYSQTLVTDPFNTWVFAPSRCNMS